MFASSRRLVASAGNDVMHRLLVFLVAGLVVGGALAGCGGKDSSGSGSESGSDLSGPSASDFQSRFAKATGVQLTTTGGTYSMASWTLLGTPEGSDHYDRFGAFSIYVVKQEDGRDRLLQKSKTDTSQLDFNAEGYAFSPNEGSDGYTVVQRFGDNVVLEWQAGDKQAIDDKFRRLSAAVEAAATGDESKIPASQRDCAEAGIDPAAGKEGTCRSGDSEITVVNAGSELTTPVLKARLRSLSDTDRIGPSSRYGTPIVARGRYLIVTYELKNTGNKPIDGLEPQLVVGERTYAVARGGVDYELYPNGERPLPLQPGDSATIRTAFDVSEEVVDAARDRGALVLPAEPDDYGYLSVDNGAAEGRIRLAGADADASSGQPQRDTPDSTNRSYDPDPAPDYSPPPPPSSSTRTIRREHRAERAVKEFFTAVRTGNVSGICNRLTRKSLANQGGMAACRSKVVKSSFQRQVPSTNRRLKFTTLLTRSDTRAVIMVSKNGYRGAVRLARQDGLWRIQGLRRY